MSISSLPQEEHACLQDVNREFKENSLLTSLYFSELSYLKPDSLHNVFQCLRCLNYSIYQKNGVQAYMAEFDDFAVLGFRGNELDRWREIKADFFCWKTEYQGIKVHKGFVDLLEYVSNKIIHDVQQLPTNKKLLYTGHSLGGALALLFSLRHKPTHLYTFGAPSVTNKNVLDMYLHNVENVRVTVASDKIPLLPPYFLGYRQYGEHICLPEVSGIYNSHRLSTYTVLLKDFIQRNQDR